MLTEAQRGALMLEVGGSAWGFYFSDRFPAEGRFDLDLLTLTTGAELTALAAAILADACAVGGAVAKGKSGGKIVIGPLTIEDNAPEDSDLAALARLWCNASARLSKQAGAGVARMPPIYAGGRQGARPGAVFIAPRLSALSQAAQEDGLLPWAVNDRATP